MIETALQYIGGIVFCFAYLCGLAWSVNFLGNKLKLEEGQQIVLMIILTAIILFSGLMVFNN